MLLLTQEREISRLIEGQLTTVIKGNFDGKRVDIEGCLLSNLRAYLLRTVNGMDLLSERSLCGLITNRLGFTILEGFRASDPNKTLDKIVTW
jgi:hypothetical protein